MSIEQRKSALERSTGLQLRPLYLKLDDGPTSPLMTHRGVLAGCRTWLLVGLCDYDGDTANEAEPMSRPCKRR